MPFGWIIGCPLLGYVSDKLGRRKPVILAGAFVLLGCLAWILYGPKDVLPPYLLGLVAGIAYNADEAGRLFLVVLVLPAVGAALGTIPAIGTQLNAVAINIALAAAGIAATVIAMRQFNNSKNDVASLASMGGAAKESAPANA